MPTTGACAPSSTGQTLPDPALALDAWGRPRSLPVDVDRPEVGDIGVDDLFELTQLQGVSTQLASPLRPACGQVAAGLWPARMVWGSLSVPPTAETPTSPLFRVAWPGALLRPAGARRLHWPGTARRKEQDMTGKSTVITLNHGGTSGLVSDSPLAD